MPPVARTTRRLRSSLSPLTTRTPPANARALMRKEEGRACQGGVQDQGQRRASGVRGCGRLCHPPQHGSRTAAKPLNKFFKRRVLVKLSISVRGPFLRPQMHRTCARACRSRSRSRSRIRSRVCLRGAPTLRDRTTRGETHDRCRTRWCRRTWWWTLTRMGTPHSTNCHGPPSTLARSATTAATATTTLPTHSLTLTRNHTTTNTNTTNSNTNTNTINNTSSIISNTNSNTTNNTTTNTSMVRLWVGVKRLLTD
eukprot:Rmarinus@m.18740